MGDKNHSISPYHAYTEDMIEVTRGKEILQEKVFHGWRGLHRVDARILEHALIITNTKLLRPERRLHSTHKEEAALQTTSIRPHFLPLGRRIAFRSI